MKRLQINASAYLGLLEEAALESLWPSRCALCDAPGAPLCERCERALPYIDQLRSCPQCGAAFGVKLCTECNSYTLAARGLVGPPLNGCRSACRATDKALKLVTTYKDRGDRTLAEPLARLMAQSLPPSWHDGFLVPIPARSDALRKRGIDHVGLLCSKLARISRQHRLELLRHQGSKDQRELDADQRLANMRDSIIVALQRTPGTTSAKANTVASEAPKVRQVHSLARPPVCPLGQLPRKVILVDDVMTTGATLFAAAEALKRAGVEEVRGLTFARV